MNRLAVLSVLFAGTFAFSAPARADVLAYDEFDGTNGGGTIGWAGGGAGNDGWAGNQSGGQLQVTGSTFTYRPFASAISHANGYGTVWYSVTMRIAATTTSWAQVVGAPTASGQHYELGFNGNSPAEGMTTIGPGFAYNGVPQTESQTFLVRYDFSASATDLAVWYAAGDGSQINPADAPWQTESFGVIELGSVYLSKGSAEDLFIDRVAIGTTAADALVPEPASLALLGLGGVLGLAHRRR